MRRFILLFLMIASLQSCKSTPQADEADIVGWLPKESDTRIRLVVPENDRLLALLLGPQMFEDLQPMISRLELLAIGIEYETNSVHLVALGKWPQAIVRSALDKQMERLPGRRPAKWRDEKGATLVLVSNKVLVYSSNRFEEILERMETGQRWALDDSPAPPETDFVMWASDAAFIRGGFLPSLSAASKAQDGLVDSIEIMLNSAEGDNYNFGMNIKSKEARYIRPLSLVMRVMFMGILGLSKNQNNRESHAQMQMDVMGNEIQIFIPSITLDPIEDIMAPINPNIVRAEFLK